MKRSTPVRRPLLLALLVLCLPGLAEAREWWVAPGTMGANALPSIPAMDPFALDHTLVTVGWGYQLGRLDDRSTVPVYRVYAPFGRHVVSIAEGTPAEIWWASPKTTADWGLTKASAVEQGDIRFGALLRLFDAHKDTTTLGFRMLVKATTGKSPYARRFTDAPAYLLDFVFGQRFGRVGPVDVTLVQTVGYFIWQQIPTGQDDALHGALSLRLGAFERLHAVLELRAYVGWALYDRPVVAMGRVGFDVSETVEVAAVASVGFDDAPKLDARLEVTMRLPAVIPLELP